uniref:Uncharacterized protein n=1 Tax=Romanomermis culicivorax TaxID=13658 RepID=A0A915KUU3_ROMCU
MCYCSLLPCALLFCAPCLGSKI